MEQNIFLNNPATRRLADIFDSMADADIQLIETGGELTPELEQIMAQDAADLRKKVDGYAAVARNYDASIDAIDVEIKRLTALKKHASNARARLLSHLEFQMDRFGLDKLEGDTCRISFRKSSAIEIDEASVLHPYLAILEKMQSKLPDYIQLGAKVSKTAAAAALDKGEPFAEGAISKVERRNIQLK